MFGAQKTWTKFDSDEVKKAVHTWLRSQPKTLLAVEIRGLVNRYKMYVEKRAVGYAEK